MKKIRAAVVVLLIGFLGGSAWAYYSEQVQQEIILSEIIALNNRLSANNLTGTKANAAIVRELRRAVYYNRNSYRDMVVLQKSQQIIARSASLTDTLKNWQQQLRTEAGEATAGPLRQASTPSALPAGNRIALARSLNRYSVLIRGVAPEAPVLALPGTTSGPGSTWLYAEGAPLAVALANLTQLETQVRRLAAVALQRQAEKVGSQAGFVKTGALAVATANTVAPGAVYEARLFLSQSTLIYERHMSVNGQPLAVGPDGMGRVEFKVPALQPGQPDTVPAQWQGLIRTQTYLGDTTLRLVVPYYVVKPRSS